MNTVPLITFAFVAPWVVFVEAHTFARKQMGERIGLKISLECGRCLHWRLAVG